MKDFAALHLAELDARLAAYAAGSASLNDLITDIEELAGIVANKALSEQLYPFLMDLEEINAACIVQEKEPSPDDVEEITALLAEIKQLFHDVLARGGA